MEKSASQLQEPTPPAAEQFPPLPTATDQRPAELPLPVSPAVQPQLPAKTHEPPSTVATEPSSRGRKRALEANLQIENSNYYKMRLILKDLRPHILEVLRTPDFRNCMAATEIQERMKLMLQLYQEMMIGGGESFKGEKIAKSESFSNTVVGGSAFGWNFITHGGTEPVYCGMTKEEYRISHPIIQVGAKVELHNTL